MARCSDLPPELIARVMEFLCDAQATLLQCSLVCRAWLSPSQRQLFRAFQMFDSDLLDKIVPFRNFLLSAPHICAYIQKVTLNSHYVHTSDAPANVTLRENVQDLFPLLPNITKMDIYFLPSFPFLFPNSLLRQFPALRTFSIMKSLNYRDTADIEYPTTVFSSFIGTTVKSIYLRSLHMPSAIDSPLDAAVCSVERLILNLPHNLPVWLPYLRSILPNWSDMKIVCVIEDIPTWPDVLRVCNLSHLHRLHVCVFIAYPGPYRTIPLFPHDDASPFFSFAPNIDHLVLTTRVNKYKADWDGISIEVISSMVEWYRCTFAALSASAKGTLKEITLTVMALDHSTVTAAWANVDDVLSTSAFSRLERVHFLDVDKIPIKTWSHPNTVSMLEQALPELSRGGKLAV